ncbi:large conductance mechanosensitive channel protein MscL [Jeotgalibaca ciconiae]|uniref:Large-conductance mechanosensitive channel n=1 Tax=Jeotgalibaca ciconiae TaxID=2496265 RepID=A0A3S9H9S7_9LACT|nr:large conductance mechanosensitive channel protein MscL [Jeotgalibaca ciconiae]AZP04136.1 large conductance mechanosensitive channel protein MscL [Jeotgalibaca ciconiae]HJB22767.1 large conductance mechanosensitive channel protein MscL [Candidatus Jeotgalibaca pullicola]
MIKEFKEFIMRGNVLDLAVGVIIGAAFSAIVNSLVEDLISPIIVSLTSQASIEDLSVQIGEATLRYGNFIQAIIDFLIIALVLFLIIKAANKFKRKNPEADVDEVEIPTAELYLKDIRDLLAAEKIDSMKEDRLP